MDGSSFKERVAGVGLEEARELGDLMVLSPVAADQKPLWLLEETYWYYQGLCLVQG